MHDLAVAHGHDHDLVECDVLAGGRHGTPRADVPAADREMDDDTLVVGDDRLDLLAKALERRVRPLDRLANVMPASPHERGRVVHDEVLGEVLRNPVELPAVPDLAV